MNMPCQHILFESDIASARSAILFEPILDTFERHILGHECVQTPSDLNLEAASLRSNAIHAAAGQSRRGLYFLSLVPASIDDPELDMSPTLEAIFEARMHPGNFVFDIDDSDLVRDPVHSKRIRDYLRRCGFGFALSGAGLGAGASSFDSVSDFQPEYIKLDHRLTQDISQPTAARTVSRLVRMAEPTAARVIAEGVDRARMLENLWLLGVQFVQGQLFGVPAERIATAAKLEFAT